MTANEIPIGAGFLGSMWHSDWNEHWKAGKPVPGELVRVTVIKPQSSRGDAYLRDLLKLHANHLHSDSSSQISCPSQAFWVVGVRETRSAKVYIFDWHSRARATHLERIHGLLRNADSVGVSKALEELGLLEEREVPYL